MGDKPQDKALHCPGCGAGLSQVYAEANYGRVLLLDQCRDCGGVWFDRWELYFLKEGSAKSLEGVDVDAFNSASPGKKGAYECPKCAASLVPFIDPGLPKDASIKRCPGCGGIWLNKGDLSRYAAHKAALAGRPAGEDKPENIETLKRLQKELKTADMARPTTTGLASGTDVDPLEPKEFAMDVGFLILQTLLRLVFRI